MPFCAYCGNQLAEVSYAPCPQCGNPSNGAPRGTKAPAAAAAGGGSKTAMIVVIVLVGGFVLIAVIGILAAIAIPNILTAQERARQKRTMADIRMVSTAIEAYATDKNQYPNATSIEELRPLLSPTYLREVPVRDGWMHSLRYGTWAREKDLDSYAVVSAGKDGRFEKESLKDYEGGTTSQFDCDIVFSNGSFLQYPEGVQRSN